jgi:predicted TIM-barrel fold metal-dependent hydrolase
MSASAFGEEARHESGPEGLPLFRHPAPQPEWLARAEAEEILEPSLAIIDAHHHLWDHHGGYRLEEFVADTSSGHRIVASIYSQSGWCYSSGDARFAPVGETRACAAVYREAEARKLPTKVCAGISGFADMELGVDVEPVLRAHIEAGEGRFRGIRQLSARDEAFTATMQSRPPADLLLRETFRDGLRTLQRLGLVFDAWLYFRQIPQLVELARALPGLPIVVNHFGGPLGIGPYRGRRDEVFGEWRASMCELAGCPNVYVKAGGLGMVVAGFDFHLRARPPSSSELAAAWAPYLHTVVEAFGAQRCMFETNAPVDKIVCSYPVLWNAFKRMAAGASAAEKAALFSETANRVYQLGIETESPR